MTRPIVIDARLNAYRQGGIPRSTAALIEQLATHYPEEMWLIAMHRRMERWPQQLPALRTTKLWTPPHHRFEQLVLPLELLRHRPRLLHAPDFIPPLRRSYPAVITVHDLAFKLFPEILDADAKRYYGQIEAAVRSAEGIIAVSQSTAADLTRLLDVPPERIDVIHHGVAMQPCEVSAGATRNMRGVALTADTFMVFVSTFEPRKNIPTLLRALDLVCHREPQTAYQLVLAGNRGWLDQPIFDLIEELGLADRINVIERPSDAEVRWLLSACRMYVNPSRYEGFGLPALEALACGAPSLVARSSSLPEVVGDAALLIEPMDVEGWADAIQNVWHAAELRDRLAQAGPARAATFTWQRTAEQTYAVYQRVLRATT